MNEPFRLRYVNQIVGAVLLIALVLFLAIVLYTSRGRNLFEGMVDYQVLLPQQQTTGLRRGSDVMILADIVGRVQDLSYAEHGGQIVVDLAIQEQFADEIFHDSIIQVNRKFGVGEPYIEILRGNDQFGALLRDLTDADQFFGQRDKRGAALQMVVAGGAAEEAGLQVDDVVVAVNGEEVHNATQLRSTAWQLKAGDTLTLLVQRFDKQVETLELTLEAKPTPRTPMPAQLDLQVSPSDEREVANVTERADATMQGVQEFTASTQKGFDETILPSFDWFTDASKSVRNTSETLRPTMLETFENADSFIENLRPQVDDLLANINALIDDDAEPTLRELRASIQNVDQLLDTLGPKADDTLTELSGSSRSLRKTLREVDEIVHILQSDLQHFPGTIPQLRRTLNEIDCAVEGITNAPLCKKIIARGHRHKCNPGGCRCWRYRCRGKLMRCLRR